MGENIKNLKETLDFIKALTEREDLTHLEKLLNIIYYYQKKLDRGLTHNEMVRLGILITKKNLKTLVCKGYLECYMDTDTKNTARKHYKVPHE